jgi:hypothetical protein
MRSLIGGVVDGLGGRREGGAQEAAVVGDGEAARGVDRVGEAQGQAAVADAGAQAGGLGLAVGEGGAQGGGLG